MTDQMRHLTSTQVVYRGLHGFMCRWKCKREHAYHCAGKVQALQLLLLLLLLLLVSPLSMSASPPLSWPKLLCHGTVLAWA